MIKQQAIEAALAAAMSTGGDFAEVFFEDTTRNALEYCDGKVNTVQSGRDHGAGIRVLSGTNYIYAYTNDTSENGLVTAAKAAAHALSAGRAAGNILPLTLAPVRQMQPAKVNPSVAQAHLRAQIAQKAHDAAKAVSPEIVQASASLADVVQHVIIANTQGVFVDDVRTRSRFAISAVASADGETQTAAERPGAGCGFEFFDQIDTEALSIRSAKAAIEMLHAPYAPAGPMPVVIDNEFGGVIFHEACGHSLETSSVSKNQSEFAGKLGQKVAHEKVTAIDDGTIVGAWGSQGYDDEGNPQQRRVLIEKGILKSYMADILGARRMGIESTGNGRRESYRYAPTARMSNTFIAAGTDTRIIETMGDGLYAKKMGGGSVNPMTGEFNFAVQEGYLVKDGKILHPVRGATLIGKGSEIIQRIDRVGENLALGEGMCGAASGSIPTCVGQPMIRVTEILVGGREG